jgi:hypothetical protein
MRQSYKKGRASVEPKLDYKNGTKNRWRGLDGRRNKSDEITVFTPQTI